MTMKSLVSCVFVVVGVVTATPGHVLSGFGGPSPAPQRFDSDDWCRQQNWGNDRAGVCEIRELTFASAGSLTVDASPNGYKELGSAQKGHRATTFRCVRGWWPRP